MHACFETKLSALRTSTDDYNIHIHISPSGEGMNETADEAAKGTT